MLAISPRTKSSYPCPPQSLLNHTASQPENAGNSQAFFSSFRRSHRTGVGRRKLDLDPDASSFEISKHFLAVCLMQVVAPEMNVPFMVKEAVSKDEFRRVNDLPLSELSDWWAVL